ncbi:HAD-IA family hydrolase [Georgenia faecalis]|uniref:HAD-IA family hydrolase n=1 Tax=Georgenia faecalis TaxID=2483799 RepID=A0ABV9DAS2_9MICO|nr:HAD-IA family hydrolase [Georgenia faecalis]
MPQPSSSRAPAPGGETPAPGGEAPTAGREAPTAAGAVAAVDTVVFDLGQVLVGWDPFRAVAHAVTAEEFAEFSAEIDWTTFNHAQDAGRTMAEAREVLARSHPHRVATFDEYVAHFPLSLTGPIEGTTEIVDALLARGLRVLGLTNWSAETFEHAARSAPVIDRLEGVVVSGVEGVAKPDPAIFALLVERFGLTPAATVFVDDSPVNVDAAAAAGLRAVRFVDAAGLRADLARLGLTGD